MQSADTALIAQLRTALHGVAGIRLAVLFGSAASGRARPDSDLDVAVLGEHGLDAGAERRLTQTLSLATGRNVDLIRLQRASTLLKWQVASKGIPRDHADRMDRRRPPVLEAFRDDVDRQDARALSLVLAVQRSSQNSSCILHSPQRRQR